MNGDFAPSASYFWLSRPGSESPPSPWIQLSEAEFRERAARAPAARGLFGPAPDWAADLHRIARAVYVADRHTHRDRSSDGWTRHIRLSVPVSEPDAWGIALPHLLALLETLTGDRWQIAFRTPEPGHEQPPLDFTDTASPEPPDPNIAGEVALFSGGLDSLAWAARRATAPSEKPLLLVQFEELQLQGMQNDLFEELRRLRRRPLRRLLLSQLVRGHEESQTRREPSTRSRGLLYATAAVHAAAAERVPVVEVPENGQLALNPPLSAARSGSCSTRSVHPWSLYQLNRIIDGLGGRVHIENPFATLTKGEVCEVARSAGVTQDIVASSTLSCGAPPIRKRGDSEYRHCGLCFPCLARRSGLLHAYGRDSTPYESAPWTVAPSSGDDHWYALRRWLDSPFTALDLVADTPLPPGTRTAELLEVIERGRSELRALVAR